MSCAMGRHALWLLLIVSFFPARGEVGSTYAGEMDHVLFRTIRHGDIKLVQNLLRQGTPVNVHSADGTTPLMVAALHSSADCVRLLLEHGADPNAASEKGVTALL